MSGAGLAYNDRVQESTVTAGTGTITLGGAVAGYQSFATAFPSPVGGSVDVYYGITDSSNNWEVGIGTYTLLGGTVSRNTVLSSSNSNTLVSFSGTGQVIWCDHAASAIADRGLTVAFSMHMVPQ